MMLIKVIHLSSLKTALGLNNFRDKFWQEVQIYCPIHNFENLLNHQPFLFWLQFRDLLNSLVRNRDK